MRGSEATKPEGAERPRGGEGVGGGCPPSHGEDFFDFQSRIMGSGAYLRGFFSLFLCLSIWYFSHVVINKTGTFEINIVQ